MSDAPETITEAVELAGAVAVEDVKNEAEGTIAKMEREIEIWWNDVRANAANLDTETHNKLHETKEALKARLRALIG